MTDRTSPEPPDDAEWRTLVIAIPPAEVLLLTSLMEACDNLAIVRTIDPAKGQLALWYHRGMEGHVEEQLQWLGARLPLAILRRSDGMAHLPDGGGSHAAH